ncbi:hypothetical protein AVEN_10408-1 [Araneus ventricosus]|uniref:Uncharacterized protein n=1 Tax=Araneus ventricosus TaxID=182803 RepID=A0A4Y2IXY4_ARAVE|nr:hypothetical protein AVEN_10408-1 [Araneus ventricosus]
MSRWMGSRQISKRVVASPGIIVMDVGCCSPNGRAATGHRCAKRVAVLGLPVVVCDYRSRILQMDLIIIRIASDSTQC